jgi:hypothetical protein
MLPGPDRTCCAADSLMIVSLKVSRQPPATREKDGRRTVARDGVLEPHSGGVCHALLEHCCTSWSRPRR